MIEVVIPVYRPDEKFVRLLRRLTKQTVKPDKIIVIHTVASEEIDSKNVREKEEWEDYASGLPNVEVVPIRKGDFDHGGTRNLGAGLTHSEYILFMTQDAVPCNETLLEELLKPMSDPNVAASYARQLPDKDAGPIERYTRFFNYPSKSRKKSLKDRDELGIKAYFCSNVCALYRKEVFDRLGGFVKKTIFNEDMIMAHAILTAGYSIYYAAHAKVTHSHIYTYREQFKRNFDLAVSHKQYKEAFESVPPESEGMRLVRDTFKYLLRQRKAYMIPDLVISSAFKYLGYKTGLRYGRIPNKLVKRLSMNPGYWNGKN